VPGANVAGMRREWRGRRRLSMHGGEAFRAGDLVHEPRKNSTNMRWHKVVGRSSAGVLGRARSRYKGIQANKPPGQQATRQAGALGLVLALRPCLRRESRDCFQGFAFFHEFRFVVFDQYYYCLTIRQYGRNGVTQKAKRDKSAYRYESGSMPCLSRVLSMEEHG